MLPLAVQPGAGGVWPAGSDSSLAHRAVVAGRAGVALRAVVAGRAGEGARAGAGEGAGEGAGAGAGEGSLTRRRVVTGKPSGAVRGHLATGKSGSTVPGWLISGEPRAGRSGDRPSLVLRERRRLRRATGKGALRLLPLAQWSREVRRALLRAAANG